MIALATFWIIIFVFFIPEGIKTLLNERRKRNDDEKA